MKKANQKKGGKKEPQTQPQKQKPKQQQPVKQAPPKAKEPAVKPPPKQKVSKQPQKPSEPQPLTEDDQRTYQKMSHSIDNVNQKVEKVKSKLPEQEAKESVKGQKTATLANQLIYSKQHSEIITKKDLIKQVHQSYEELMIELYTENKLLKNRTGDLTSTIKALHRKIYHHLELEEKLTKDNQNLKQQLLRVKDEYIVNAAPTKTLTSRLDPLKGQNQNRNQDTAFQRKKHVHDEDYDFWNLPEVTKKKKENMLESSAWLNQRDLGQSMQMKNSRKYR